MTTENYCTFGASFGEFLHRVLLKCYRAKKFSGTFCSHHHNRLHHHRRRRGKKGPFASSSDGLASSDLISKILLTENVLSMTKLCAYFMRLHLVAAVDKSYFHGNSPSSSRSARKFVFLSFYRVIGFSAEARSLASSQQSSASHYQFLPPSRHQHVTHASKVFFRWIKS